MENVSDIISNELRSLSKCLNAYIEEKSVYNLGAVISEEIYDVFSNIDKCTNIHGMPLLNKYLKNLDLTILKNRKNIIP